MSTCSGIRKKILSFNQFHYHDYTVNHFQVSEQILFDLKQAKVKKYYLVELTESLISWNLFHWFILSNLKKKFVNMRIWSA